MAASVTQTRQQINRYGSRDHPKAEVALNAPALAAVIPVPGARAGAPPVTQRRLPGAQAAATSPTTEKRVAAGPACARWWRPAEAPISCAGCPARPSGAWRCRGPSAPGWRRAAQHFAARLRDHASWSPAAATRERRRWARAARPFPMPPTQPLRLAQMSPAARTPVAARRPERQVGSAAPPRSRGRTAGSSPAPTTTN